MKKKIAIEGMSCSHCVSHVKEALSEFEGVTEVNVNLESKTAILESLSDIKDEAIQFAIEDAGYGVVGIEVL
ncbi:MULTISPECIES: heavy-metal-associated domain-containing protein [Dehalobacter]|jgi:copper ion binding protein|uniref:Heavy metal transport/detoxification protein n=2 Tax=Dehalobacter restrictus TaxID=55583 RepID=A0A857DLE6_9FIRM|nr:MULTISPECIES: heavy metal-associated domain-containing protein [Dehalobacter]AHF10787.1 copper chaperone CopZ [Dehalobacter restrictus DSM 9455]MCG1025491.1 heavy-metal-associated domain-containing protein [Dehalobacter sp.]OCZ54765.1 heavy metal transport/detoxification protein [Dehalobacter sp. TeCB1]QHA01418.1 heavy metal transport/detoxification protein [Dehalobacter restrictus]